LARSRSLPSDRDSDSRYVGLLRHCTLSLVCGFGPCVVLADHACTLLYTDVQLLLEEFRFSLHSFGGWWRWALVRPDGVAPSQMIGVSASVNLSLHHKVQRFSSGTGSPGWSRKKGRKTVVCHSEVHNQYITQHVLESESDMWARSQNRSRRFFRARVGVPQKTRTRHPCLQVTQLHVIQ